MTETLICGDCLEVMRGMEECSVDSIVTDPPYGLEFMGKDWDHGIPGRPFWVEALRVAKPGTFLLAFGGTRTFHRLTCAIEDAGWEIRDCMGYLYGPLLWCFGSGFPKSHNIGCKCRGGTIPYSHDKEGVDSGDVPDVREEIPEASVLGQANKESFLQLQLQRERTGEESYKIQREHEGTGAKGQKVRGGKSVMEGRSDILAQTRELQADKICPVSEGILGDGPQGRLCNGASPDNGKGDGKASVEAGSCPSPESQSAGQPTRKPRTVRVESGAQDSRICSTCGGLLDRIGYGSALKPAYEPIIIARKPLDGTLRQNVLKWGTGAMNIDGSRVGTETAGARPSNADGISRRNMQFGMREFEGNPSKGRWPANLIHDGSDEVVGLFPETKSGGTTTEGAINNWGKRRTPFNKIDSSEGSAARFFYCAKASRAERETGLEGMEPRQRDEGRKEGNPGGDNPRNRGFKKTLNHHPTVKPLALMRYLCRLVTPPGGLILDPFMGSGTTGMAAKQEGFDFIGIETDAEYFEIAEKRISSAKYQRQLFMN